MTVYSTDHGKEYPLANVDLQAQKVLFIESSADPILIKGADTSEIIAKGKSMCTGNERSPLPDISDKKLVRLAENRIIMNLPDPLSFKPVSNKVRKDDENIYVTISYKAKVNGQLVDGEDVAIFDYWARFVGFE